MFQVHRTDTGQFVLIDPRTGIVVIEDELAVAYERLEALAAERPANAAGAESVIANEGSPSAFAFKGRRTLMAILAIGLPFVWFLFVYLALRDLDRPGAEVQAELEALRAEVSSLRSAVSSTNDKPKPTRNRSGGVESGETKPSAAKQRNSRSAPSADKAAPKPAERPAEVGF